MTLSDALKEAYASNSNNDVILNTIEIRHPSFVDDNGNSTSIRIVRDNQNHILKLENNLSVEFIAGYFDFVLPSIQEKGLSQLQLSIDGISREIAQHLESASRTNEIIEAVYRLFLYSTKSLEMDPVHGIITNVSVNIFNITGYISFTDYINKKFPEMYYSSKTFPGLT